MDLSFALTVTIAGMGVTLVTLYLLTLLVQLMCRVFPYNEKEEKGK